MVFTFASLPELEEGEQTRLQQADVRLCFGDDRHAGNGTLYLTTTRVLWESEQQQGGGFQFLYNEVVMHAVGREPRDFALPCLYCQLEDDVHASMLPPSNPAQSMRPAEGQAGEGEMEEEEDDDDVGVNEVRFVPADPETLKYLFDTFSECSALNPDPDSEEDEQEGGGFFANIQQPADEAAANVLEHLNNVLSISDAAAHHRAGHDAHPDADNDEEMPNGVGGDAE